MLFPVEVDTSKRRALSWLLAAASPLVRTARLVGVPLAAIGAYQRAQAFDPVTVSATAQLAASVVSLFQKRKTGPSAEVLLLNASLDYQRLMFNQLTSLQLGMAEVLTQLHSIKEDIRLVVDRVWLDKTQADLKIIVELYSQEIQALAHMDYERWTQDSYIRQKLAAISFKADEAAADIKTGSKLDVLTCLQLPALMYASLGTQSALGRSNEALKHTAQRFLDLMETASNPKISGTVAQQLEQFSILRERVLSDLKAQGVSLVDSPNEWTADLGSYQVTDYTAASSKMESRRCRRHGGGGRGSRDDSDCYEYYPVQIPERVGGTSAFGFDLPIQRFIVSSKAESSEDGVVQYRAPVGMRIFDIIPQPGIQTLRTPAASGGLRRSAAMAASQGGIRAQARADLIAQLLSDYNVKSAQCALHAVSLATLADARQRVLEMFGVTV